MSNIIGRVRLLLLLLVNDLVVALQVGAGGQKVWVLGGAGAVWQVQLLLLPSSAGTVHGHA